MLRDALTPELLNAHPHHDNSAAWLLWHAAREIDEQLSTLTGQATVWQSHGFAERFDFTVEADEMGYGHSTEQARAIRCDDAELLLEHLSAVIDAQVAYIDALDAAALGEVIDDAWDPPVTLAARLVSLSVDAAEHIAQAAYITGMGGGAFER